MTLKLKGIKFQNPQLLITALTHRSVLNEKKGQSSYERLEFLGDAVLELVVSNYLFIKYKDKPEGELTHLRAKIVQTKTLAKAATKLKLGDNLILSKGEQVAKGDKNPALLADAFEAVIGAIYIDQGLPEATQFITSNLLDSLEVIIKDTQITDYKSQLQETWQKKAKLAPTYKIVKTSGPDHNKNFEVNVYLNQKLTGKGEGKSKQVAQQQAAKKALERINSI